MQWWTMRRPDAIFDEFRALLRKYEPKMAKLEASSALHSNERVKNCFAVVARASAALRQPILKKSIIRPD